MVSESRNKGAFPALSLNSFDTLDSNPIFRESLTLDGVDEGAALDVLVLAGEEAEVEVHVLCRGLADGPEGFSRPMYNMTSFQSLYKFHFKLNQVQVHNN